MKNTNKIIKLVALFIITLPFSSCNDLLTDTPENQYSEEQVFSTAEGTETAVNGMYYQLQGYDYYGGRLRLLLWPHSGKYFSKQGANSDANQLNVTNNNLNLGTLWLGMYQTINQTNIVIANVEGSGLSNEATSLGQAYFLRAVVYFDLVRMFEEAPIKLVPSTKDNIHVAKSSKEELYNQVISDLKKAANLLPDRGQYIGGRPLKYAANAYLAKVYVTLAGENSATIKVANFNPVTEAEITAATITNFWEEAKTELDFVINNGGYTLATTYADLFKEGARNSSESIFELQYGHTGAERTNDIVRDIVLSDHASVPKGITTFGRILPNKEMFSDHIIQYSGKVYAPAVFIPSGNNAALINLDNAVADPRINATYVYNSYVKTSDGSTQNLFPRQKSGNFSYPAINKYGDLTYDGTTTFRNLILLRYADVLLLRAEVENELTGPTAAYTYVNRVLLRARTTTSGVKVQPADWTSVSVPTKEAFRERIMKEREYELNGEGHEWFDMRRRGLGRFQEQITHHNNATVFFGSTTDLIFTNVETQLKIPIPLTEISTNNLIND
ncbi:RagB/SusD family nutrient uptake outer membrane protein [Flavobacterium sp. NG2]|uniref:RagB/SusD family nutrient uptake outer membrane protein n=1 Tax=Flavobacterium sp. NG2 TaxID=3097547 RepID=UPI002A80C16C|nr:RagB/SusD family nutrient uptake outer membrane protein [Flavobacterium sp. NG2]WPR71955.1 RagB/SusD family nutrient uptake outer membrane protein [Flavobacterium sp. NG2]